MPIARSPARRRSQTVRLAAVPLLAAAFLGGCGSDDEAMDSAYCVNAQDQVVDDDLCDDGRAGYFVYFGGFPLRGSTITRGTVLTRGERVDSRDRAAVARRGGFGGSARPGGVGRAVGSGDGGGFSAGS
jgi:hypothetical protein